MTQKNPPENSADNNGAPTEKPSVFTQILEGKIDSEIIFQDDEFFVINDIRPQAPVHVLIITKKPFSTLEEISLEEKELHADMLLLARKMAEKLGIKDNYKIVMNVGKQLQEIYHFHLHLMGGWKKSPSED